MRPKLIFLFLLITQSSIIGQSREIRDSTSFFFERAGQFSDDKILDSLLYIHQKAVRYFRANGDIVSSLKLSNEIGESLLTLRKYQEALSVLAVSGNSYSNRTEVPLSLLAANHNSKGKAYYFLRDYPSAKTQYLISLELRKNMESVDYVEVAKSHVNLGLVALRSGDITDGIKEYKMALSAHQLASPKQPIQQAIVENSLANAYFLKSELDSAAHFARNSLKLKKKYDRTNIRSVSISQSTLANILRQRGDYFKAEILYEEAVSGLNQLYGPTNTLSAAVYVNLSGLYFYRGLHNQAITFGEKALVVYRAAFGEAHPNTLDIKGNLASYKLFSGNSKEAISGYEELLNTYSSDSLKYPAELARTRLNLGASYLGVKKYQEALTMLKKAENSEKLSMNERASLLKNLAESHYWLGDYQGAKTTINKAEALESDNDNRAGWTLVLKSRINQALGEDAQLSANLDRLEDMEAADPNYRFEGKLLRFESLKRMGAEPEALFKVLNDADQLLTDKSIEAFDQSDKLGFVRQTSDLVAKAIPLAHDFFEQSGDTQFLEAAWRFAEVSKGRLMAQATLEVHALEFGGVPKQLVNRELDLRSKVAFWERDNAAVSDSLFHYRAKLFDLVRSLERNYPKYFELKYASKTHKSEAV